MADIEQNMRNVAWLDAVVDSASDKRGELRAADEEVAGVTDMLIVGIGGFCSVVIATLGVWKLAELIV